VSMWSSAWFVNAIIKIGPTLLARKTRSNSTPVKL
jgi:hypothetical protein